jgi:hypothetical protein
METSASFEARSAPSSYPTASESERLLWCYSSESAQSYPRAILLGPSFAPRGVGHYITDPPAGHARVSSNDVTIDDRGLIYLVDRQRGVDIIETNVL